MKWKAVRLSLPGLLILTSTACSLAFVKGPPDDHQEMEFFQCTESRVLPILDVVGAGTSIIGAATAEDDPGLFEEDGQLFALSREANIAVNVVLGAAFSASALLGFKRVSACRAATEELRHRLTVGPPQPTTDARWLIPLRPGN
jgi:hypothetical protein